MFHPYHAKHKFRMKWWPIQCEQHCHSSCVLSSYSNTLPSSTLTTAAPSQQMTCLKKTPSTNPVSMPVIQPNREVPGRHSNTNQLNHEVPDRHSIQFSQTRRYLTGTQYKPWSPWQTLTNHEVPDRHSQTMKYPTDTQYKPWSTRQTLNTNQPNHEVPDRYSKQFSQTMKYLTGTQYKTTKATIPKSQETWLEDWYRLTSFVSHTTQQN